MGQLSSRHKIVNGRTVAEMLIYGPIGETWFDENGVSAAAFAKELKSLRPFDELVIGINSDGGDVADGIAIYNQARRVRERVTARVDGMALSAASVIAMAGDSVSMAEGSFMMVHDPLTLTVGNAEKLREVADLLDKHGDSLSEIYARRTQKPADEIREIMRAETWYDANEAVEAGFADTVEADAPRVAAIFDASRFRNAPARFVEPFPRRAALLRKMRQDALTG